MGLDADITRESRHEFISGQETHDAARRSEKRRQQLAARQSRDIEARRRLANLFGYDEWVDLAEQIYFHALKPTPAETPTDMIYTTARDLQPIVPHIRDERTKQWAKEALAAFKAELRTRQQETARTAIRARQAQRAQKLEQRPTPVASVEGPKCSSCHKKPAKINDLCKKCARAEGIIIHGKIGAS